ncbi:hypothetical protein BX600DRAFT_463055 [Xylariales sp. PMI_506]|nr:hypothetical protein BX600DRAFT_463055 [Xylariales sp. PMI_506]
MAQFSLSVRSFTPPTLPDRPVDAPASAFRSPKIPSIAAATSPLFFTLSLPSARDKDPLYPATHLQLSYHHEGTGEVFPSDNITAQDLVKSDADDDDEHLYIVQIPPKEIPRAKVNEGTSSNAEVNVYAWRREKLLGKWKVGEIEKLGFEGLKSTPLAVLRQKTWKAQSRTS